MLNSLRPFLIVAIDGGAASGKSSTARRLSEQFNLLHSDTGSYYRSVTAELLRRGVRPDEPEAIAAAVADLGLGTRVTGRAAQLELAGRVLAPEEIRSAGVNENVSKFAAVPALRHALLDYQRGQSDVARAHGFRGLVMEGRDIGSMIFPDAPVRIFLTADPDERARRRAQEGQTDNIAERDRRDTGRKESPLACPPGATAIDSTHLTLEDVVARVGAIIEAAFARA